jgi:ribonucleoside-diphosphate reductase alpha chain
MFITMAKEGSTIGGLMDCFGTAVSMSLQYGVPLEVYVNKFSHTRFEPMGFTKNPDIKIAKSIVDYIFRWLGITFLPGYREANKMPLPAPGEGPAPAEPTEPERWPAATMAGGPPAAQGSAKPRGEKPDAAIGPASSSGNGQHGPAAKRNGAAGTSRAPETPKTPGAAAPARAGNGAVAKSRPPALPKTAAAPGYAAVLPNVSGPAAGVAGATPAAGSAAATTLQQAAPSPLSRSEQFASFQTDAPSCDNCGAITVRNGNCYLCYNCGNSMGCS